MGKDIILSSFEQLNAKIEKIAPHAVFVLVDKHTREFCLPILTKSVDAIHDVHILEIQSGESQKTIEICTELWTGLSKKNADRKSLLINLGGGVICDIGGFVASTFKRGIQYINIPTTLLAMADAAIGGKCGIDMDGLKNLVGLFGKPEVVFLHPGFLKTLPMQQVLSGYAEIVKIALTSDTKFWQQLKLILPTEDTDWTCIIEKAVALKQSVTAIDPYETGPRKLLNFGHTSGHAVESVFLNAGKPILHGEAVALGMIVAANLSTIYSVLSEAESVEIENYIRNTFKLPIIAEQQIDEILNHMKHDKKNEYGQYNFTLLKRIGEGIWDIKVREDDIRFNKHIFLP